MDLVWHIVDLSITGMVTSLCVLVLAKVGLFPSVVLSYYVLKEEDEEK